MTMRTRSYSLSGEMSVDGSHDGNPLWINICILAGCGFFVFALVLSAVFDPTIRVLHTLQALIYVFVVIAARRASAWGFGAGVFISAFWNYANLFVTTFVRAGVDQLVRLAHTGHLKRPDLLVALVAAAGHFLVLLACAVGFARLRPRGREWTEFLLGGIAAVLYFVAIIYTTGPQYIPVVRRVFHL